MKDQEIEKDIPSGDSHENINCVCANVIEEPKMSMSRRSQEVGLRETTTCYILYLTTGWRWTMNLRVI